MSKRRGRQHVRRRRTRAEAAPPRPPRARLAALGTVLAVALGGAILVLGVAGFEITVLPLLLLATVAGVMFVQDIRRLRKPASERGR